MSSENKRETIEKLPEEKQTDEVPWSKGRSGRSCRPRDRGAARSTQNPPKATFALGQQKPSRFSGLLEKRLQDLFRDNHIPGRKPARASGGDDAGRTRGPVRKNRRPEVTSRSAGSGTGPHSDGVAWAAAVSQAGPGRGTESPQRVCLAVGEPGHVCADEPRAGGSTRAVRKG